MLKGILIGIIITLACLAPALAFLQVGMSASVESNVCNQNLEIIRQCCQ